VEDFILSEKEEILFMETRLIRLASEKWHLPIDKIIAVFRENDILRYIEVGYNIFHCEGDEAVLEDIEELIKRKKVDIDDRKSYQLLKIYKRRKNMSTLTVSKERLNFTVDLLITMVVEELAKETGKDYKEVLTDFLTSKTGKALYDDSNGLWHNGPSYIAAMYIDEKNHLQK